MIVVILFFLSDQYAEKQGGRAIHLCRVCMRHFQNRHALEQHQELSKHTLTHMPKLVRPSVRQSHMVPSSPQNQDIQVEHHNSVKANDATPSLTGVIQHDLGKPILPGFWLPKRKCRRHAEKHPSEQCSQEEFMLICGLVTSSNASRLKHEAEENLVDLDCQIVAVEGLTSAAPLSSPRSSISLMAQLSRQTSLARKRLIFDEDADGSDKENTDVSSRSVLPAGQGSLLGIAFSSPLGQRLKKHIKIDLPLPIVNDVEKYCKTLSEKTEFLHKLRLRPLLDYPVTFRKRKRLMCAYNHTYKFNSEERREFVRTYRTGLNKNSRLLRRQMKKCVICLRRVSEEEIKLWSVKRRTILNQEIPIDDDISIVQVDIPESSYRAVCQQLPVITPIHQKNCTKVSNSADEGSKVISRESSGNSLHHYPTSVHSSIAPQRSQFLVKKVSKNFNGQESQKLFFVPLEESHFHDRPKASVDHHKPNCSTSQEPHLWQTKKSLETTNHKAEAVPMSGDSKPKIRRVRKQLLSRRKDFGVEDNDITIESCSSSDEDIRLAEQGRQCTHKADLTSSTLGVSSSLLCKNIVPSTDKVKTACSLKAESTQTCVSAVSPAPIERHADQVSLPCETSSFKSPDMHRLNPAPSRSTQHSRQELVSCTLTRASFSGGESKQWVGSKSNASTETIPDMHLSAYNVRGSKLSNGDVHLSIDAVYSAADLSDKQFAASLGLQFSEPLQEELQQAPPNFLHLSSPPIFPGHACTDTERFRISSSKPPEKSMLVQRLVAPPAHVLPSFRPILPRPSLLQPQVLPLPMSSESQGCHDLPLYLQQQQEQIRQQPQNQPTKLVSMDRPSSVQTKRPAQPQGHQVSKKQGVGHELPGCPPLLAVDDWHVVPAYDNDDDVVEIICIDDD